MCTIRRMPNRLVIVFFRSSPWRNFLIGGYGVFCFLMMTGVFFYYKTSSVTVIQNTNICGSVRY